ncbi:unnamed protein product [Prunus armeniaca]|uniref:Uncharacterized protein n=1 Tax=Prunus armeniaca TaxID=36596 RepID=A0A6J5TNG6_PRUAR|nr:unnamed protein product [Prunus armeniaca]CAB4295697.1 unnamed protein product [Prunus armeniaca]
MSQACNILVSELSMEEQRVARLETEVVSLATGQERILKEMQEMFSAMNAHLDQISRTGDGSSIAFNGGGGRTFGSGSTTPNSGNSYLPKMVKLDFPHSTDWKIPQVGYVVLNNSLTFTILQKWREFYLHHLILKGMGNCGSN